MREIALNYIYLSRNHAGGKDQVGLNLLKGFYKNGVSRNMVVFCYDYSRNIIGKLAPDIQIVTLKSWKDKNELQQMFHICYTNTFEIPHLIKKYRIRLIYHLNCNNGLQSCKAVSVMIPHDIKAVAHRILADVKIPFYKYVLYRIMYEMDFRHAASIIAISDVDQEEISHFYSRYRKKIKRIYNPIDIECHTPQKREGNYICAVNLQFHHKNIITLIKAFELIQDKTDCDLVLIGKVPDRVKYLKEYVEQHGLQQRIVFTGFVTEEEMQKLFRNARLYVNPTLYEGFGMTAIEAMIDQIPTLVSGIPTNYEVTQGLCSYYEPPEDEQALAEKMLECLSRPYTQKELLEISITIREAYRYDKISRDYFEHFSHLLKTDTKFLLKNKRLYRRKV